MVAWIQAWDAFGRVRRALVCALLACCAAPAWGQVKEGRVLADQKQGTLIVNYYASAPDPELEQLRSLTVDALGVYLRGQIQIENGDIGWQLSLKHVLRDMERVVSDLMRIRDFAGQGKIFMASLKKSCGCLKILKNWIQGMWGACEGKGV